LVSQEKPQRPATQTAHPAWSGSSFVIVAGSTRRYSVVREGFTDGFSARTHHGHEQDPRDITGPHAECSHFRSGDNKERCGGGYLRDLKWLDNAAYLLLAVKFGSSKSNPVLANMRARHIVLNNVRVFVVAQCGVDRDKVRYLPPLANWLSELDRRSYRKAERAAAGFSSPSAERQPAITPPASEASFRGERLVEKRRVSRWHHRDSVFPSWPRWPSERNPAHQSQSQASLAYHAVAAVLTNRDDTLSARSTTTHWRLPIYSPDG